MGKIAIDAVRALFELCDEKFKSGGPFVSCQIVDNRLTLLAAINTDPKAPWIPEYERALLLDLRGVVISTIDSRVEGLEFLIEAEKSTISAIALNATISGTVKRLRHSYLWCTGT